MTLLWHVISANESAINGSSGTEEQEDLSAITCPGNWLPSNHFYFQLANTFFFLSYLAPNGIYGILYLRVTLTLGSFFFSLWGFIVICALDTAIWNFLFLIINLVHAFAIIISLKPQSLPSSYIGVYTQLFAPLKVSRKQFNTLLKCTKEVRQCKRGETYALESKTNVDKLTLVMSGRFLVSQNGKPLNFVGQYQFLDSPEWFGMSTDECFQVSIAAVEESQLLIWNRDKLKLTINGDQFLQAVFDHILGKDVVNKLMQVNETCMTNGLGRESDDDKVYLLVQRSEEFPVTGAGATTKQIQEMIPMTEFKSECQPLLPTGEPNSSSSASFLECALRETDIL